MKRNASHVAARAVAIVFAIVLTFGAVPVSASPAARDRTPPTPPTNLRVTATTPYSVSLAWNPSTDNSGSVSYVICCGGPTSATTAPGAVSFTYTAGMEAGRSYSFRLYAVDPSGNKSRYSNSVSVRLPADTIAPTAPVVSVTAVGPTHVALAWSTTENGPHAWFTVFKDGTPVIQGSAAGSGTLHLLKPETTYTLTVQVRDFAMNWSPVSQPISVTTAASNPNDLTPPTVPTTLRSDHYDTEIHVRWDQSTDTLDPQSILRYDVFINGVLGEQTVGRGFSIVYGDLGLNTIEVVAVDTAGNASAPATIMVTVP